MEIKYLLNLPLTDSSPFALENRSNSVYMVSALDIVFLHLGWEDYNDYLVLLRYSKAAHLLSLWQGYEKVDLSSSAVHLLSLWHLVELINEPFDQLGPDFQALINLVQTTQPNATQIIQFLRMVGHLPCLFLF